jgi:hypothetical protein
MYDYSIVLEDGATLDLAGHTLTVVDHTGIVGERKCRLIDSGPGAGSVRKSSRGGSGIQCEIVSVSGVDFEGFSDAIAGNRVRAHDVTVVGSGHGIRARRARVSDAVLDGNDNGLSVGRAARLDNVSASSNTGFGIDGGCTLKGRGVTANANGQVGIDVSSGNYCGGSRLVLEDSAVTGNAWVDLRARRAPHVTNTACDKSVNPDDGAPWGVCGSD